MYFMLVVPPIVNLSSVNYDSASKELFLAFSNSIPDDLVFKLSATGFLVEESLSKYCKSCYCRIPIVFGGNIDLSLVFHKYTIYSRKFNVPNVSFCTDERWETRICSFRDICYNENKFQLVSPYRITFDHKMLCVGSKTPPVDLELNRMIDKFQVIQKRPIRFPIIQEDSYFVSIYYNMRMLWHKHFDFLLPLYLTITNNYELDLNKRIFVPDFAQDIPEAADSLSKYSIKKLENGFCFKNLTIGMVKVTNITANQKDPPYSFCSNCTYGLRTATMEHYNINETNNMLIVLLGRRGKRKIINEIELKEAIQDCFPNFKVILTHFENTSTKNQIEIISRTELFISIHGSGLANMIWLPNNASIIEIKPVSFTCSDWYFKASKASGINYYSYEALSNETYTKEIEYKKCISKKKFCSIPKCFDIIRDRDVKINLNRFKFFLKSIQR